MVPYPSDGITGEHHGRAVREKKFEPLAHFEAAMGQVTMQIKCRAHSAPEKERQHDRQIGKLEARHEPDHPEQLQCDQDNENEKIKFFVLEHAAR